MAAFELPSTSITEVLVRLMKPRARSLYALLAAIFGTWLSASFALFTFWPMGWNDKLAAEADITAIAGLAL